MPSRIRLITRGDDSGSTRTANAAIRDAFVNGIMRNTSVMVPGPYFDEAATMFRDLHGLCVGLHMTLTAEWVNAKWVPVLPRESVSSLVDSNGYFPPDSVRLHEQGASADEIVAEIRAQLGRARSAGLDIRYADEHMGIGWVDNAREALTEFFDAEGVIYSGVTAERLPRLDGDFADPVERFLAQLDAAEPGSTYLVVGHPCYDTDELKPYHICGREPGSVGPDRDWQRRLFMDPRVLDYCVRTDVEAIRYDEA